MSDLPGGRWRVSLPPRVIWQLFALADAAIARGEAVEDGPATALLLARTMKARGFTSERVEEWIAWGEERRAA